MSVAEDGEESEEWGEGEGNGGGAHVDGMESESRLRLRTRPKRTRVNKNMDMIATRWISASESTFSFGMVCFNHRRTRRNQHL